jgi:Uma2 family endonuclease
LSPGGMGHSRPCARVVVPLENWSERTRLGRVYVNEIGLVTQRAPDSVRGADAVYLSYAGLSAADEPEGCCPVPPELVVEVIGKGQGWRKPVEKAGDYLHRGVDRVWILDPRPRSLHVFRPDAEPARLEGDDVVRDESILPDFSCTAAELFERKPV